MGQVMGEQAREGGGGGTPSAVGLRPRGAFEERPLIIQACGDARAPQARREAIFRATTFPDGGSAGLEEDRRAPKRRVSLFGCCGLVML